MSINVYYPTTWWSDSCHGWCNSSALQSMYTYVKITFHWLIITPYCVKIFQHLESYVLLPIHCWHSRTVVCKIYIFRGHCFISNLYKHRLHIFLWLPFSDFRKVGCFLRVLRFRLNMNFLENLRDWDMKTW